jgi:hypothetical protein
VTATPNTDSADVSIVTDYAGGTMTAVYAAAGGSDTALTCVEDGSSLRYKAPMYSLTPGVSYRVTATLAYGTQGKAVSASAVFTIQQLSGDAGLLSFSVNGTACSLTSRAITVTAASDSTLTVVAQATSTRAAVSIGSAQDEGSLTASLPAGTGGPDRHRDRPGGGRHVSDLRLHRHRGKPRSADGPPPSR